MTFWEKYIFRVYVCTIDSETPMTDAFGRRIRDVRIAVNSDCNLRCLYCHSEGESNNGCNRGYAEFVTNLEGPFGPGQWRRTSTIGIR